jgi:2'-5' RNA ligase
MYDLIRSLLSESKEKKGTYVGVRLTPKSTGLLRKFAREIKVPNILANEDMHITVIFSRNHIDNYKPLGKLDPTIEVEVNTLTVFQNEEEGSKRILVVTLKAPELTKRHNEIMKEPGATYDFDSYIPHVTLSYDCGDFDETGHGIKKFFKEPLEIDEEYEEELTLGGYE